MSMSELSLYFHIPYCKMKCFYCDFNSYSNKHDTLDEYLVSIEKEIDLYAHLHGSSIRTIFFGGGTPSIIESRCIRKIIDKCNSVFDTRGCTEISIEANPESLTEQKLYDYRNMGINRLSIGLQAWQDRLLKKIGRIHTLEKFIYAFSKAREASFDNINVDLIFSLPEQSVANWVETLLNVVDLSPEHVSCYGLKIEEGTRFHKALKEGEIQVPNDETDREMYYYAQESLNKFGYNQYEISNFAKPGYECVHNMAYWTFKEYIGFGAGAHSFFDNKRVENENIIEKYISQINKGNFAYSEKHNLSKKNQMTDYIITGLRLIKGIDKKKFYEKFDMSINDLYTLNVTEYIKMGLLDDDEDNVKFTPKGLDLSNLVLTEFV